MISPPEDWGRDESQWHRELLHPTKAMMTIFARQPAEVIPVEDTPADAEPEGAADVPMAEEPSAPVPLGTPAEPPRGEKRALEEPAADPTPEKRITADTGLTQLRNEWKIFPQNVIHQNFFSIARQPMFERPLRSMR